MTREREQEIIAQVLSGDTNAFELLVLENQKNVYNLALRITRDEQQAFDVSQETFLKAFTSLKSFRGDSRFSAWLYRLTSNICIDFLRKEKRQKTVSITYDNGEGAELEIADLRNIPETELERCELREVIENGLLQLSEDHRRIVVLRDINGLSYAEISEVLGLEIGTVKSRLARARMSLAKLIDNTGNFSVGVSSNRRKGGG
ncbi:MAG: sigma-70 family RNA polymerase sigma factor [Clostridiales bacterium]|nr:sigma-70 family RNA polymerase sigma factor [Clostridiales bacterium]